MGAVTYPKAEVVEFIEQNLVPLQVLSDAPMAKDFNLQWTPTLIVLDTNGKEHHRAIGFLPPEELILMLVLGSKHFDNQQFSDFHPETLLTQYPRAMRLLRLSTCSGCTLQNTHDPAISGLRAASSEYAASEWTNGQASSIIVTFSKYRCKLENEATGGDQEGRFDRISTALAGMAYPRILLSVRF
jgi:hypothetical protein